VVFWREEKSKKAGLDVNWQSEKRSVSKIWNRGRGGKGALADKPRDL